MASRGLVPPADRGLSLRNYVVTTSAGNPEVAPRLQLRLAHDCSLLPDPDAMSIDFRRCEVNAREYAANDKFSYFKLIPDLAAEPAQRPMQKSRCNKHCEQDEQVTHPPQEEIT